MRILEVNKFYYARRGAERHFLDVIDLLKNASHQVRVFSMMHPENLQTEDSKFFPSLVAYNSGEGSLWEKLKGIGRLFYSFEAKRKMQALLDEWQPDVAHLHNIYHQLSPSILAPLKAKKIPIIMTVHDYNLISPDKDTYYPEMGKAYYKFLFVQKYSFGKRLLLVLKKYFEDVTGFYKTVNLYILPSEYVKATFVEAGFEVEKLRVLPHFITTTTPIALPETIAQKLPASYAISFGSLSEDKGTTFLIELCERLAYPLVLVGSLTNGYTLPVSANTTYLGVQDKSTLTELIKRAECVLGASELPETFGLVPLETIALGKPFIGLKAGAYAEIINSTNGYLATDKGELERYLKHHLTSLVHFDTEAIKEDAEKRFSKKHYLLSFEQLLGEVT